MLRLLTVAACALVVGGGFAIPRLGLAPSAPPGKAAALQRLGSVATTDSNTEPVVPPDAAVRPISARMLGPASPIPIPPSVLRMRNGWLMSDGRTLVAVYAGAAGNDPSVGRLVVVRQNLASGAQTVRIADAGATGPSRSRRLLSARSDGPGRVGISLCGQRVVASSISTSAVAEPSQEAHEPRLRWPSASGPDRVTKSPNRPTDSTVATVVLRLLSNRKVQLVLNAGFGLVLLGVAYVSVRHFVGGGWPIHHADPVLTSAAALLFLAAYAFKAWGWQRLFHASERPTADALAFAGGAACVGGIALPGRVDDAIRIAVVRRYPGTKTGIGTLGLSLIVLGMLDNAALTPMASVAAAGSNHWTTRAGFAVVAAAGIAAAAVVAFLPRIAGLSFVTRWRLGRWVAAHTHCTKEAWAAWLLISVSWTLRAVAVFLLLNALSMPGSFVLALAFLVASAASAALPIAPAGAATQAGAGAAILALGGVHTADAIAFSIAAQALVIVTGAAVILLIGSWQLALRVKSSRSARAAAAAATA